MSWRDITYCVLALIGTLVVCDMVGVTACSRTMGYNIARLSK